MRMRKTNKKKLNIPICVATVLLCLTMISITLTSSLYARYATASSGSDDARVASFNISTVVDRSQQNTIKLTAADNSSSGTYKFTIANNSEVAVKYSVIVKNVPNQVKVVLNGTEKVSTGSDALTFEAGELAIGGTATCTLTFFALDGSTTQITQVAVQAYVEQVD